MALPTWLTDPRELNSWLRHVYTAVGAIVGTLAVMSLISGVDATGITNALHQIGDGVAQIAAGVGALIPILSGIWAVYSTKFRNSSVIDAKDVKVIVGPNAAPEFKAAAANTKIDNVIEAPVPVHRLNLEVK